ncbi:hypothetical protein MRX96_012084 [Rhipicephalus microplus]
MNEVSSISFDPEVDTVETRVGLGDSNLGLSRSVGPTVISWFPVHMGRKVSPVVPNGNELNHAHGRELTYRAGQAVLAFVDAGLHKKSPQTFI